MREAGSVRLKRSVAAKNASGHGFSRAASTAPQSVSNPFSAPMCLAANGCVQEGDASFFGRAEAMP